MQFLTVNAQMMCQHFKMVECKYIEMLYIINMFEMVIKPFGENMFTKGGLEYFKMDLFLL